MVLSLDHFQMLALHVKLDVQYRSRESLMPVLSAPTWCAIAVCPRQCFSSSLPASLIVLVVLPIRPPVPVRTCRENRDWLLM